MNILLTLAFKGANYHGFQVQKNALSVCAVVQDAMQALFGCRPDVKGCSRTDAGVHARGFCLSFAVETSIPVAKLPLALNSHLPGDIRVLAARQVPVAFHARYSAAGKTYQYRILNRPIDDPFEAGLYYRFGGQLDIAAMQKAARHLLGSHDCKSFQSAGSDIEDTVRTIQALEVRRGGDFVLLDITADGFLYNMVRIIAGTLLEVGQGSIAPEALPGIIAAKDRAKAGPTLPAKGLFLVKVQYPPEAWG